MAQLITVASGKGGVGKSVLVSNLGLLLAAAGRRTVMADLDTGGADLAILFGEFALDTSLGDFMSRSVQSLNDALTPIAGTPSLWLLAGSGNSLATANPAYATKQRVLRHLRELDADVVLIDIGTGAGLNQLDFFLAGDVQVVVTTPDPTALMDAYRFIKLAAIRKVVMLLSSKSSLRHDLSRRDFTSIAQVRAAVAAGPHKPEELAQIDSIASTFCPKLVLNRAGSGSRVNYAQVRELLRTYTSAELEVLGEVPQDALIEQSVRGYLPVVKGYPNALATRAMAAIATALLRTLDARPLRQSNTTHYNWEDLVESVPAKLGKQ